MRLLHWFIVVGDLYQLIILPGYVLSIPVRRQLTNCLHLHSVPSASAGFVFSVCILMRRNYDLSIAKDQISVLTLKLCKMNSTRATIFMRSGYYELYNPLRTRNDKTAHKILIFLMSWECTPLQHVVQQGTISKDEWRGMCDLWKGSEFFHWFCHSTIKRSS